MTYGELLAHLRELNEEQLKMTVTVYSVETDEAIGIDGFDVTGEEDDLDFAPSEDVLDDGHPYLIVAPQ